MMKTKIILIFILAILLSSCHNNEPSTGEQNTVVSLLGSTQMSSPISYSELVDPKDPNAFPLGSGSLPVLWSPGDEIGVFAGKNGAGTASNVRAILTEGAHKNMGKFITYQIKDGSVGDDFFVYHPFVENADDVNGQRRLKFIPDAFNDQRIRGNVPEIQEQKAAFDWSHFKTYSHSIAITTQLSASYSVDFNMKHCLSYIAISLYTSDLIGECAIKKISIKEEVGAKMLTGTFESYFNRSETLIYTPTADGKSRVQLNILNAKAMSTDVDNPDPYLLTIIPADLTGTNMILNFEYVYTDTLGQEQNRACEFNISGTNFKVEGIAQMKFDLMSGVLQ